MATTLFLQSEVDDPYKIYETMLAEHPVYWDDTNQLWAIYSYEGCITILNNSCALIPAIDHNSQAGLNEHALLLLGQFARFSNGYQHDVARLAGMLLFEKMSTISINDMADELLPGTDQSKIDWVDTICNKLPVSVILRSFEFNKADGDFISDNIEHLVKITSPVKTPEQVKTINELSKQVYDITEKHLSGTGIYQPIIDLLYEKYQLKADQALSLCVSNLVGLFIQSYDASRGLLSNSMLQILINNDPSLVNFANKEFLKKSVTETLRFDPPVHNTRRIAVDDIVLGDNLITKGSAIFLILAAANGDPQKFHNPGTYNIERSNNMAHLTFGSGGHACLAKHFSTGLAIETLSWLFEKYKNISLLDQDIAYEPMVNIRMPKSMLIAVS